MLRPSNKELEALLSQAGSYAKLGVALGVSKATAYRWCKDGEVGPPVEEVLSCGKGNVLALPDLHAPFHDWKALEWAASLINTYNITKVIQLGDITDSYAWSRWGKDTDAESPQKEFDKLRIAMHRIQELFPQLTIVVGNHDTRMLARATDSGIPSDLLKGLNELFPFEGWDWHLKRGKPFIHNGIAYLHGDELAGGLNTALAAERLGMSVVYGHTHQGRLMYSQSCIEERFGMQCGCLIDTEAYSMRYAKLNANKVWKGVGIILDGVPHLIPYRG